TQLDFDSANQVTNLGQVLAEARPRDSLTLWHLLRRVEGEDRIKVYERLAVLVPPPASVTREGILRLDRNMLDLWQDNLENSWTGASSLKKGWLKLWTSTLGRVKGVQGKK